LVLIASTKEVVAAKLNQPMTPMLVAVKPPDCAALATARIGIIATLFGNTIAWH
jgi:hypothetical protein